MCLCASVFSMCSCVCVCFFYNLQSPRTSRMTECKYSHAVFYPKMASASSGTNIVCLRTYIWVNGIKKSLFRCQIMLQFFLLLLARARIFFRHVNMYAISSGLGHLWWHQSTDRVGLSPSNDHAGTRQPGHCPINQLVNVIRRTWRRWDRWHMLGGLLSRTVGYSGR